MATEGKESLIPDFSVGTRPLPQGGESGLALEFGEASSKHPGCAHVRPITKINKGKGREDKTLLYEHATNEKTKRGEKKKVLLVCKRVQYTV